VDPEADRLIRTAIAGRRLIRFQLGGLTRIAEPHDYGIMNGIVRLFVYQVGGRSRSGRLPDWRLVTLAEASDFELLESSFSGRHPVRTGKHQHWDRLFASVSHSPFA
jgi:hypothetical protein